MAHGLVADGFDHLQDDQFVGQESQRPAAVFGALTVDGGWHSWLVQQCP